ncbi:MAG: deoxyguanosinetriphosphate triphosphohydrolase [Peptococcaceae bacterium]|nr:deoxyguanosinetriphosphate triphosphohydrolase [Peptococcaceae bacterium]
MTIREKIEDGEHVFLEEWAAKADESLGRAEAEEPDAIRTCYMRDRDRIIHSKSFRRLKHKTQVYLSTGNDHYRTRLTHTLEVSQISRTVGRALGLNLDLIEAVALGHDVGHTPFSHSGESVLDALLPGGFNHQANSVRVLTLLEEGSRGRGLNLTRETLDGILNHRGMEAQGRKDLTLEGQTVRFSDKIAYVQHDIDDSIRAGLLKSDEIPQDLRDRLGDTHSRRISTLIEDMIYHNLPRLRAGERELELSGDVMTAFQRLRQFMFDRVYKGDYCLRQQQKAAYVVKFVFEYFYQNPHKMPALYRKTAEEDGAARGAADYISGMTDRYCIDLFQSLTVPAPMWEPGMETR